MYILESGIFGLLFVTQACSTKQSVLLPHYTHLVQKEKGKIDTEEVKVY